MPKTPFFPRPTSRNCALRWQPSTIAGSCSTAVAMAEQRRAPTAAIALLLEIIRGQKKGAPSSYFFSTESLTLPLVKQRHSGYMNTRGEDMGRWRVQRGMFGRWSSSGKRVGDSTWAGGVSTFPLSRLFIFLKIK